MKNASLLLSSILIVAALAKSNAQTKPVSLGVKIDAIIQKMTLEEKVAMLHANSLFSSAGVKRLGIPDLQCDDGPLGIREEVKPGWASANLTTDSATFFPNGSALAASETVLRTYGPFLFLQVGDVRFTERPA